MKDFLFLSLYHRNSPDSDFKLLLFLEPCNELPLTHTDYSAFLQVYNIIIQEGEFGLIVNPFMQIDKNFIL